MSNRLCALWVGLVGSVVGSAAIADTAASILYHCPGNIITNEMSARQAKQQGCRVQPNANMTILPESPQPVAAALPASAPTELSSPVRRLATTPAAPGAVASTTEQRARDSDSHSIISAELKNEQAKLATLRQKPPSAERADAILRSESDIAALERELARNAVKVGR